MKKRFRRFVLILFSIIAILCLLIVVSGKTYLFKAAVYNFADIDDYKIFSNDTVPSSNVQPWDISSDLNKKTLPAETEKLLNEINTIAVVAIKNDSLFFEKYWEGYSDSSYSGSFSVAKSITSILIGIALKEGKIKSLNEPVGNYIPEFKEGEKAKVKIVDLLTMSSGTDFDESYANPLSITTEIYYGSDLYKTANKVKIVNTPGTLHRYKSGDTQLLGLLLEKATGVSLSKYAAEKLWKPIGAIHPALWSTDTDKGHIKAFCCFNTNARDFARIGQLMLYKGKWNGIAIIDSTYWAQSITPCNITDDKGLPCNYYGYQWWIDPLHEGVYYARGILGQYIIVIPQKNTVVVRLGKQRSQNIINTVPEEVNKLVEWALTF